MKRRRAVFIGVLCIAMLVIGYVTAFFMVAFQRPVLLSDGAYGAPLLFKIVSATEPSGAYGLGYVQGSVFPESPETFHGDYECAATLGAAVYVFSGAGFSEYRASTRVRAGHAPDEGVLAALETSHSHFGAYGNQETGVARPEGQPDGIPRLFCVVRLAQTKFALCEYDGNRWTARSGAMERPHEIDMVRVVETDNGMLVAWREIVSPGTETGELPSGPAQCAKFRDGVWGEVHSPETRSLKEYSLITTGGRYWFFYPAARLRDGRQICMEYREVNVDGKPGAAGPIRFEDVGRFMRFLSGLAAAGRPGGVMFIFSMTGTIATAWVPIDSVGEARVWPLRDLGGLAAARALQAWCWGAVILFLAASLVFLGLSLLAERLSREDRPSLFLLVYEVAAPHRRAIAYAADLVLAFVPQMALLCRLLAAEWFAYETGAWWLALGVASVLFVAYLCAFEWRCGRTPGKMVAGLIVMDASGGRITGRQALLRNLMRVVDGLHITCAVGALFMIASEKTQRAGDLLAGTVVVNAGSGLGLVRK
ncbi:MAG: RDD family protein [Planctomycetota bacterium]|nr:RDD family protein [Planctomycetota bacterium]